MKLKDLSVLATAALLATGCATVSGVQAQTIPPEVNLHGNKPYQDHRSVVIGKPASEVNDAVAVQGTPKQLDVLDENGQTVKLDLTRQPVLFFWYDCGFCQQTLATWGKDTPYPILVSMGFVRGTPLVTAKQLTQDDLTAHHVPSGVNVFYRLSPVTFIHGYPTLLFPSPSTHQLMELNGLHTPNVWQDLMKEESL